MRTVFRTPFRPALPFATAAAVAAFVLGASLLLPSAVRADDRDVLRDSAARPYVFIVLDTSGSMNWSPRCTAQQVADGICSYRCDTGDCSTPRNGDDPASKFRQSKEALYEVLKDIDDIDFGFATYNQDNLGVLDKHWLYRVRPGQPQIALAGGLNWPVHGTEEVFGATFACDRGGGDAEVGCYGGNNDQADANDLWEVTRVRRWSKLGSNGSTATAFWLRSGGNVYYVSYDDPAAAQTIGAATVTARIRIDRCTGSPANNPSNNCDAVGERTNIGQVDVVYDRIADFVMYDYRVSRTATLGAADGWFGLQDSTVEDTTCEGWEPNTDSNLGNDSEDDDYANAYSLKYPTLDDPAAVDRPDPNRFDYGDVLPLDWLFDNKDAILNRLASRLNGGDPATDPEAFANATYLNDNRLAGQGYLRYKNENLRSLFPNGSTPLGWTLKSFREWYRGCENGSCNNGPPGWDDIAAVSDPKWACRRKFLIVLTDGDDTCPGRDPCSFTASMRALDGILTYVVAFGVQNTSGNRLNCMAANGGTGDPIYPQNKAELVEALTNIFGQVREQAAAFASAAVPQVQANVSDKIFLSSFTPVNNSGYWAGRLDAFLKPLPLTQEGEPDRSVVCSSTKKANCFLWDAGDVQEGHRGGDGTYNPQGLLLQAPHPDDLAATPPWTGNLQLGIGADERRVIYSNFNEPGNRRLFSYPVLNNEKYDLWSGLGIPFIPGNVPSETAAQNEANTIITTTLLEKEALIEQPDPDNPGDTIEIPLTYLMGDIFHSDPIIGGKPNNFSYYTGDPYPGKNLCGAAPDPARQPPVSYRWFADRHACRRTILLAGANDGQMHVFDAGIFRDPDGAITAECLLPAKDLDGDGNAEANEYSDSEIDYDLGDDAERQTLCTADADCQTGPCSNGVCRDMRLGVIDGVYDNGSGREIFSFIPRGQFGNVVKAANGENRNSDFWGLDGSPRIDDVFIDPLASDTGSVTCGNREWRSVAVGGYREGGTGYYALDITQPDELDNKHVPQPDNGYVPSCFGGGSACGNRPYPSVLWEFQDEQEIVAGIPVMVALDEDLNGIRDLANSWSRPTTGRIRVCTGACTDDETEDRFVAIFGGGVGDTPSSLAGNFLYMVDIETGKTIYKKPVTGAIPADVAAVDTNGDSYIDRLYAGTTAGFVYKVQFDFATTPMRLASQTVTTRYAGVDYNFTTDRITGPIGDTAKYDPFQVFSTGGKPIYHEISAVFVASKNRIAMAFGTGNRWNLWDFSGTEGRFYVILDDNFADANRDGVLEVSCGGCTAPLTESSYIAVDPESPSDPSSPVFYLLSSPHSSGLEGWYHNLEPNEKVITEAFSLSGVTIFTSFVPTEVANSDGTCSRAGSSRIFIVGTVTAIGYNIPPGGTIADRARYAEVPMFTTPPFVEQSATANPEGGGSGTQHADFITDSLAAIRDELKSLQSTRCRYANYTQNIKTIRSDTGVVFIAPIPLCIDPTSWKEF